MSVETLSKEDAMTQQDITSDMKVWEVIQAHPETVEIFLRHGCPDMRRGFFSLTAHVMNVKWAAKMHKIPLDQLMNELNLAIHPEEEEGTVH